MSALRRLELAIPGDVSLVGYNDIPIVSRLGTPMTTVRVPFDQIAVAALDLLNRGPEGTQDRIRVAAPTLIPRRSTAVAEVQVVSEAGGTVSTTCGDRTRARTQPALKRAPKRVKGESHLISNCCVVLEGPLLVAALQIAP